MFFVQLQYDNVRNIPTKRPIKVNSNAIELIVHTSCNCVLDLLCVPFLSGCVILLEQCKQLKLLIKTYFLSKFLCL